MRSPISITALRYVVFGLFIVFSAVTASVAVWNHTFLQESSESKRRGSATKIDSFLVFVGASGLFVAFAILFTELARQNAFPSQLWFEISWISLYFLMELAGAIASSVVIRQETCASVSGGDSMGCTSTRTLMAFTWLTVILLLFYTSVLTVHVSTLPKGDHRIWSQSIHSLRSIPKDSSTKLPSPSWKSEAVLDRQPRPPPSNGMYSYRSGLSPDYRIEHFDPPTNREPFTNTNQHSTFIEPRPPNALHTHPAFAVPPNYPSQNAARVEGSLDAAIVQLTSPNLADANSPADMSRLPVHKPAKPSQVSVKPPPPTAHRPRPSGPRTNSYRQHTNNVP